MAKTNYRQAKNQKEKDRKARQQQKLARKQSRGTEPETIVTEGGAEPAAPAPASDGTGGVS